jgi:cytochrome b561
MPIRNLTDRWGSVSIGLHWLTFILILGLAPVGYLMQDLPNGPFKVQVFALHKSFGLTVLALSVLRLLWRLFAGAPAPVTNTPVWQNWLAGIVAGLMYLLLLLIPLSGWWFNSASGFPLKWFGLFSLPKLGAYNPGIKDYAAEVHSDLFLILAALLVLHATAALWHHYRLHDRVLKRMLPSMPDPKPEP